MPFRNSGSMPHCNPSWEGQNKQRQSAYLHVQRPDSSQGHAPLGRAAQAFAQSPSEGPSAPTPGAAAQAAMDVVVVVVYTIFVVVIVVVGIDVVPAPWQVQTPDSSHGHTPAGSSVQAIEQSSSLGPYAPTPSAAMQLPAGIGAEVGEGRSSQVHTPDSSQGHVPDGTKPQM